MVTDYRNVLRRIRDDLRSRENFHNFYVFIPPRVKKSEIENVEARIGRRLPESMLHFYNNLNGLSMKWTYIDPENPFHIVTATTEFRSLEKAFSSTIYTWQNGDMQSDVLWSKHSTNDEIKEISSFMVLDELGHGNYVVFRLYEDEEEIELFLFSYRNRYYPLTVSFSEYIDLLLETRGMYFWQEYVTSPDAFELNREIPDNLHENMALLFPDVDLSKFRTIHTPLKKSGYNSLLQIEDKVDYKSLVSEKVEELQESKNISELKFEPRIGVHIGTLRKARVALSRELPISMLAFYTCMNGFDLEWRFEDGKEIIKGQVHMPPIEDVLGGYKGLFRKDWDDEVYKNILWMEDYEKDDIEFMKSFKIIDVFEGESRDTVIRFVEDTEEPQLFLRNRWEYHPLIITFGEYIELLLKTLGLEYWQDFVTATSTLRLDPERYVGPGFYERMTKIFPNADLSKFRELEQR